MIRSIAITMLCALFSAAAVFADWMFGTSGLFVHVLMWVLIAMLMVAFEQIRGWRDLSARQGDTLNRYRLWFLGTKAAADAVSPVRTE